jgi:hypothetical protein
MKSIEVRGEKSIGEFGIIMERLGVLGGEERVTLSRVLGSTPDTRRLGLFVEPKLALSSSLEGGFLSGISVEQTWVDFEGFSVE